MHSVKIKNLTEFKPNRATQAKPEIVDCTRDESGEILTLVCTNGKHWDPIQYARLYNTAPVKILKKGSKGNNPNKKVI